MYSRIDRCPDCGAMVLEACCPDEATPTGITCRHCGGGGMTEPYILPFHAEFVDTWAQFESAMKERSIR